ILVLYVAAELHGHRVIGVATAPDGDGEANGLEVDERDRRHEDVQSVGKGRLHDEPPFLHRTPLPVRDWPERYVLWQIVDCPVALLLPAGGSAPAAESPT